MSQSFWPSRRPSAEQTPTLAQQPAQAPEASRSRLEQLWAEAESFGRVNIYSSEEGVAPHLYCCTIKFRTISGTTLEARPDFRMTLSVALSRAIGKAREIREAFK